MKWKLFTKKMMIIIDSLHNHSNEDSIKHGIDLVLRTLEEISIKNASNDGTILNISIDLQKYLYNKEVNKNE